MLAAPSGSDLRASADALRRRLAADPSLTAADLGSGRPVGDCRAAVVVDAPGALTAGLGAIALGESAPNVFTGERGAHRRVAFLFTGQGSQRAGMGRDLYEASATFARHLDAISETFEPLIGRSVRKLMFEADAETLDRTEVTQPALFALEVALFRLAESFDLRPDFLIGHSIGELSAAHVAGVMSLADACRLVAARGRLMGALPEGGAMVSVRASEVEVGRSLSGLEEQLSLAAVNAPQAVVISGDADAVDRWGVRLEGRRIVPLKVSHAFHSPLMEPMIDEFRAVVGELSLAPPRIPVVSNVSGVPLSAEQAASPEFWARQVRDTVRFADGVSYLEQAGVTCFLELGPDAILSSFVRQTLSPDAASRSLVAYAMRRRRPAPETFVAMLAQAHAAGAEVDGAKLSAG